MIRSMTGFGRCEKVTDSYKITAEIKSVNHRYLDMSIKMPKKFGYFEAALRNLLKNDIQRGKVDVYITYEDYTSQTVQLKYNERLAAEYVGYFAKMKETFGLRDDVSVSMLAHMPEVLSMEEVPEDEESMWKLLSETVKEAADAFVASRIREGGQLQEDLLGKLDEMLGLVEDIENRSPSVVEEYRRKLTEKVKELLEGKSVDESRIVTETTVYADRICVDEETVRLRSHIASTRQELTAGGSVGRKLDFIAQEMNREANTILSKSGDLEIAGKAIELKTGVEKIREQIQNIE